MELKILEERKNPLLQRTEIRFEVGHPASATPTRDQVRQELSKLVHVPKDRLVVERMTAEYGRPSSRGLAVAYDSKEALDVTVREHILVRNGLREKKSAQPPEAAAASPPPAPEPPAAKKE